MERLNLRFNDAHKALNTLKEVLNEPFSIYIRDASIQRFEYTFEAFWKYIKEYLKVKEGIVCNSPKACFRELFSVGKISEDESVELQEMTDSRNETVHAYKEKVAEMIYSKIGPYAKLMHKVLSKLKN